MVRRKAGGARAKRPLPGAIQSRQRPARKKGKRVNQGGDGGSCVGFGRRRDRSAIRAPPGPTCHRRRRPRSHARCRRADAPPGIHASHSAGRRRARGRGGPPAGAAPRRQQGRPVGGHAGLSSTRGRATASVVRTSDRESCASVAGTRRRAEQQGPQLGVHLWPGAGSHATQACARVRPCTSLALVGNPSLRQAHRVKQHPPGGVDHRDGYHLGAFAESGGLHVDHKHVRAVQQRAKHGGRVVGPRLAACRRCVAAPWRPYSSSFR